MDEIVLKYAATLGGPAGVVALGLWLYAMKFGRPKQPDALAELKRDLRELSDAVIRLNVSMNGLSTLSDEVARLRVAVAKIEGALEK